eukprot:2505411-Pyramimonas_sp.AAC.1
MGHNAREPVHRPDFPRRGVPSYMHIIMNHVVGKRQVGGNLSKLANPHPRARVRKLFANVGKLR